VVGIISSNRGWTGLFVMFICFLLIGTVLMVSTFTIGSTSFSKSHLQNILDLAIDRAVLELEYDKDASLYALGEGYTISGQETNHFLKIDRLRAEEKFFDEIARNLDISKVEFILLTPINFDGGTEYTIVLDGVSYYVNSIQELSQRINDHISSTDKSYVINIENSIIDKPTYCAVIAAHLPLSYSKPIILHSFGGGQSFRKY